MRIRQQHLVTVSGNIANCNDVSSNQKLEVKSLAQSSPSNHTNENSSSAPCSNELIRSSDANTTYLKPDFIDPLTSAKHESVCASPLALLAKTCQNIGQMLETNGKSTNFIQTTASSHMKTVTCSPSNSVFVTQFAPTTTVASTNARMNRIKKCNTVDRQKISPQLSSLPDRFSWKRDMLLNSFMSDQSAMDGTASITTSLPHSRMCEKLFSCHPQTKDDVSIQSLSSMAGTEPNPIPSTISAFYHTSTNRSMNESSTNIQTTSNALEQLAKLSSRLPVAESPQHRSQQSYSITSLSGKDRSSWVQPLRVQTGNKRTRKPTDPNHRFSESSSGSPSKKISLNASSPENKSSPYLESANLEVWNTLQKYMESKTDDHQLIQSSDAFSQTFTRGFMDLFNRMIGAQISNRIDSVIEKANDSMNFHPSLPKIDTPTLPIPHPIELMSKLSSASDNTQQFCAPFSIQRCPICGNQYTNQFEICAHFHAHMIAAQADRSMTQDNSQLTQFGMNPDSTEKPPSSPFNSNYPFENAFSTPSHNNALPSADAMESRYLSLLKFYTDIMSMYPQQIESQETITRALEATNLPVPQKSSISDLHQLERKRMAEVELYSSWMKLLSSSLPLHPHLGETVCPSRQYAQQTNLFPTNDPSSPHSLWSHLLNPTGSQVTVLPKV